METRKKYQNPEVDSFIDNIKNGDQRPFLNGIVLPNGQYYKGKDSTGADVELIGLDSNDYIVSNEKRLVRYVKIDPVQVLTLSGSGTVGTYTDIDCSSATSSNAYAINVRLTVNDSGSAANSTYLLVREKGNASFTDAWVRANGHHINSQTTVLNSICGCDTSQIIQYKALASGGASLNGTVNVMGYWEYIK